MSASREFDPRAFGLDVEFAAQLQPEEFRVIAAALTKAAVRLRHPDHAADPSAPVGGIDVREMTGYASDLTRRSDEELIEAQAHWTADLAVQALQNQTKTLEQQISTTIRERDNLTKGLITTIQNGGQALISEPRTLIMTSNRFSATLATADLDKDRTVRNYKTLRGEKAGHIRSAPKWLKLINREYKDEPKLVCVVANGSIFKLDSLNSYTELENAEELLDASTLETSIKKPLAGVITTNNENKRIFNSYAYEQTWALRDRELVWSGFTHQGVGEILAVPNVGEIDDHTLHLAQNRGNDRHGVHGPAGYNIFPIQRLIRYLASDPNSADYLYNNYVTPLQDKTAQTALFLSDISVMASKLVGSVPAAKKK